MARLSPDKCIFLVCDVQERFRSAIHNFPAVLAGSQRMLKAAIELKIPTIVTEQYPKGLGKTVDELDVSHAEVFEKTTFTMLCPAVAARPRTLVIRARRQMHLQASPTRHTAVAVRAPVKGVPKSEVRAPLKVAEA